MIRERLLQDLSQLMEAGVLLDPLLVHSVMKEHDGELAKRVEQLAHSLYERFVQLEVLTTSLEEIPFSPRVMRVSLREAIVSTAVAISHASTGSTVPTMETLQNAYAKVSRFITRCGISRLYKLYFVIAGHDLLQPFVYRKDISEAEYFQGIRHHPYPTENLELFLMIALSQHALRLKRKTRERMIQLTRYGAERYRFDHDILVESGYIAKRVSLSYVYHFDTVQDWDSMCKAVWPDAEEVRSAYIDWLDIPMGFNVLEVGCGTGALMFDSGLYHAVGCTGQLTGIDISQGMLEQAFKKLQDYNAVNVELHRASVENMPFADGIFDMTIACAVMHFVNPIKALQEMARVTKPGGVVTVFEAIQFNLAQPFFRDWFEPIFELARKRDAETPHTYLPADAQEVRGWFHRVGLRPTEVRTTHSLWVFDNPEMVVQHLLRGVSFFQTELMELPWDDRRTIISELVDRGADVCRKYPLAERTIHMPSVMVRARRPFPA